MLEHHLSGANYNKFKNDTLINLSENLFSGLTNMLILSECISGIWTVGAVRITEQIRKVRTFITVNSYLAIL